MSAAWLVAHHNQMEMATYIKAWGRSSMDCSIFYSSTPVIFFTQLLRWPYDNLH